MSMQYIREKYGIPIKRGMKVCDKQGQIAWITRATHHIHVKVNNYKYLRFSYHPGDLDYWIDDEWKSGEVYVRALNERIVAANKALNDSRRTLWTCKECRTVQGAPADDEYLTCCDCGRQHYRADGDVYAFFEHEAE